MIVELENDYVDVKSADFVKDVDLGFDEYGIFVSLKVRSYEEPNADAGHLDFHTRAQWEPLIEDAVAEAINSVRGGAYHTIDIDELTELRDEWIAMVAQLNRGVRMLTQAINGAKEIEL